MEISILDQKKALRLRIGTLRAAMPEDERLTRTARINKEALSGGWLKASCRTEETAGSAPFTVFTYIPMPDEVDIRPLIQYCFEQEYRVIAPKVSEEGRNLSLHSISSFQDLETGYKGILEPGMDTPLLHKLSEIDLMLVPGIAFDRQGGRLGFGRGFYDRFLGKFQEQSLPHPLKLALAFGFQMVPAVPMEGHDLRVDQVITEDGALISNLGKKE